MLDPDQEVQGAVRTIFDLFAREGTAFGVVRRFNELGLRFPRRSYGGAWNGKFFWGRLTHSRVLGVLANPSYAGIYVFGRYQSSKEVSPRGDIRTRSRLMPKEAWRIVIPDHHEGYISADQFATANRERLTPIRPMPKVSPVPHAKACAFCKACSYAAFAGAAWESAIRGMVASTRFTSALKRREAWPPAPVSPCRRRSTRLSAASAWSRQYAGDDRARARGADEPGGAGSRNRRTMANADRARSL